MARFLFVSSYDLRRNTSSNIRTIALMESLSNHGHVVDVAYLQSSNIVDSVIEKSLVGCCRNQFLLLKASQATKTINIQKKQSKRSVIKRLLLDVYSRIFVYDIFQTRFKSISKASINKIKSDYDYIVSSSEPRSSHKLATLIKKTLRMNSKWIQYWGDPMTNDVASNKWFPYFEKKEEKKLLKIADFVLYTNPGCSVYMKNKYPFAVDKIHWIPTSDIIEATPHKTKNNECSILLSYVGDYISRYRDILPLYNACVNNKYNAVIAGNSDIKLEQHETIKVLDRVDRLTATKIEESSQILVVLDNNNLKNNICIQVPGKLYHFALCHKYVLVITNSNQLVDNYKQYRRFVFCKNNESSISKAVCDILNGVYQGSYCAPLGFFSQQSIAKNMEELLDIQDE